MSDIYTEERPEEYGRYDIGLISALELRYDEEDDTKCSDRIVEICRNSDIESYIPHEDRHVECCRHDDPPKCDLDTRSNDPMSRTSPSEHIGKE